MCPFDNIGNLGITSRRSYPFNTTTSPEKAIGGNASEHDLHESSEVIGEGDIVVDEEEIELTTTEVLEDVGVTNSDDDLDLHG